MFRSQLLGKVPPLADNVTVSPALPLNVKFCPWAVLLAVNVTVGPFTVIVPLAGFADSASVTLPRSLSVGNSSNV
jgi:hypothetical protein